MTTPPESGADPSGPPKKTGRREWLGMDMNDRFFFGGLAIATVGGCFLSVPITLIVLGVVLAWVGLRGAAR